MFLGHYALTDAQVFEVQKYWNKTTLECKISPLLFSCPPPKLPNGKQIQQNLCWMLVGTIPALTILALMCCQNTPAPGLGCLITTISTFMERILFTGINEVSPFLTDEDAAES